MSEHPESIRQRLKSERAKWWKAAYAHTREPGCMCGYPLTPDGPWYQPHSILGPCPVHKESEQRELRRELTMEI